MGARGGGGYFHAICGDRGKQAKTRRPQAMATRFTRSERSLLTRGKSRSPKQRRKRSRTSSSPLLWRLRVKADRPVHPAPPGPACSADRHDGGGAGGRGGLAGRRDRRSEGRMEGDRQRRWMRSRRRGLGLWRPRRRLQDTSQRGSHSHTQRRG